MDGLFSKKRTVTAYMHDVRGKMVKPKKAKGEKGTVGAGVKKKVVEVTFHIPLTKRLRELVDPRIASLCAVEDNATPTEIPINKFIAEKVERFVKMTVLTDDVDKPAWTCGGAPDDNPVKALLKSILVVDKVASLVILAQVPFKDEVWAWGGANLDGGECKVEMVPVQLELPLGDGEGDGDEEKTEKKWRGKKKEEETAALPLEPESAT